MKRSLTICAMVMCFAIGSLSGGAGMSANVRESPGMPVQVPCLKQYPNGLALCTDNKLLQMTWSFPTTDWQGQPVPLGCPIALQMNHTPMATPGQFYSKMQFIYSKQGGAMYGPALDIVEPYWQQLKAGLNAQGP